VFLLFVVIAVASLIYIWWIQNFSRFFTLLRKIPGPPGYPIIGNLLEFIATPEEMFKIDRKLLRQYYPLYKEWTLNYGGVNMIHPDDVELVLSSSKHNEKSMVYNFLHSWLGTGLLTSTGAKWQTRRKILTPAFHFTILQQFVPVFNEGAAKLVEELKRRCDGDAVDVVGPITQFTLLSIAETSMGIKLDDSPRDCTDYQNAIYTFGYALTYRMVRPWLYNDSVFFNLTSLGKFTRKSIQTLHDFSRRVITEREKNFTDSSKPNKRMAMLDLLLSAKHNGADIDDDGIAEEVDTFMFEGHDTTTIAITYVLLLLANHPTTQQEIYDEMTAVLGTATKTPTYSDLKELSFMERCLKECLRLYPSVPFIARRLDEDITTSSGYVVPKNAMAQIHIYDLHRNPEYFPDPEKFDPDRFLPENAKNRHPFVYLPFSAGPRNCIGQRFAMLELKAALCAILGNFVLEAADKREDIVMITEMVLRPKNGVRVNFRLRK
jgi:cytochrome P450 family 4